MKTVRAARSPNGGSSKGSPAASGPDAFVSYAREDRAFVSSLAAALRERDKKLWIDTEAIPAAAPWNDRIRGGIQASKAFVFVLSADSLSSPECEREWRAAVELHKRLIPVLRGDVVADAVPPELGAPNWVLLREGDDFEEGLGGLVEALEGDLAWRDMHARLTVRAGEWRAGEQDRGFLLHGADLRAAEAWLGDQGGHSEAPTAEQVEYIVASRRAATRRQRVALGAVVFALGVAIALAVLAIISRREAIDQSHTAQSRELAASAISQLDADPELSLLLAREATDVAPTSQATAALRRALGASLLTRTIRLPADPVGPPQVSADGHVVVQAFQDRVARMWDLRTGRLLATLRGHRDPRPNYPDSFEMDWISVAIRRDARLVATSGSDGVIRLWDWRRERSVQTWRRGDGRAVAFSPDGSHLAVGTGTTVEVLALGRRAPVAELYTGFEYVAAVAFDTDGTWLTATGLEGAQVWDWALESQESSLKPSGNALAYELRFSGDGRHVALAAGEGPTEIWRRSARPRRVAELDTGSGSSTETASFDPAGDAVLTGGSDGIARVWDWRGERVTVELPGHRGALAGAVFAEDGEHVVTTGADRTIRTWRLPRAREITGRRRDVLDSARFSPDGKHIVVGATSDANAERARRLQVWDASTGRPVHDEVLDIGAIGDVGWAVGGAFDASGALVVGSSDTGVVHVSDWRRRRMLARLSPPPDVRVGDAALSPDGRLVAAIAADRIVRLWDWRTKRMVASVRLGRRPTTDQGFTDGRVLFHPDGKLVVAADATAVVVWDWRSRRVVARHGTAAPVRDLDVSADGRLIAIGAGLAEVWDWEADRTLAELRSRGAVSSVAFAPTSDVVVTGSGDGAATAWDVSLEQVIAEYREPLSTEEAIIGGGVLAVDVSPDGRTVMALAGDSRVRMYPCDACAAPSAVAEFAARRATRVLNQSERRRYLPDG